MLRKVFNADYLIRSYAHWLKPFALSLAKHVDHHISDVVFLDDVFWARHPEDGSLSAHLWVAKVVDCVLVWHVALYVKLSDYDTNTRLFGQLIKASAFELDKQLVVVQNYRVDKRSAIPC